MALSNSFFNCFGTRDVYPNDFTVFTKSYGIKDAILVIPCSKGSNGFSAHFKGAYIAGVRPAGWISRKIDARLAVAIASLNIPAVVDFFETDPIQIIKTGDWVEINGKTGEVVIARGTE